MKKKKFKLPEIIYAQRYEDGYLATDESLTGLADSRMIKKEIGVYKLVETIICTTRVEIEK